MIREKLIEFIPPRFHKRNGFRYLYSFALVADATLEAALQGMAARFPGFGTETALSRISRDRGIMRGFQESAAAFAVRVRSWLDDHAKQGNAFELMRQVQGYCNPATPMIRHVIVKGPPDNVCVWRTLNTDGTTSKVITGLNFDWDGGDIDNTYTSRAWLIIYSTGGDPWSPDGTWDDAAPYTWDEDVTGIGNPNPAPIFTWGSTALLEHVQGVQTIVREWKGAQTLYPEILVSFDDTLFDPTDTSPPNPDGNWRYYSKNVAGTQVAARDLGAVYWAGAA